MRLLQLSLRSMLLYSLAIVIVSIPISLFSIREILNDEVDESLTLNSDAFAEHLKHFEYLDDLETDLHVLDQLSYNIHVRPSAGGDQPRSFQTVVRFDSAKREQRPFRELSSTIVAKGKPYMLTVSMSLVDNDDLIRAIGLVQVVLIILLTGGLLLINRMLSKRLWKPFYNTISQLKAYELDKNEAFKTVASNIIEFDDLSKAIAHLTDRNRKIYLQQKEFIENASHELQTPLAVFQSKLDILMQNPALSESSAETISALEATAQRMSRLNKNLLLLSKIDNEQFVQKETTDLTAIVDEIISRVLPVTDANEIQIVVQAERTSLRCNGALMEVLLTNLIQNTVRNTRVRGRIQVALNPDRLEILNTGSAPLDADTIFQRFKKHTAHPESTGLGLAIVKKICDLSGYRLSYSFQQGNHRFSVAFSPEDQN